MYDIPAMLILPLTTPRLRSGDDLAAMLHATGMIENGDILVVSSKAVATAEGATTDLEAMKPSDKAKQLAKTCRQDPRFTQSILNETERMNGDVVGTCPLALLTSLKPDGMKHGRILCPNAGLDQSNVEKGRAVGWPVDAVESARRLKRELELLIKNQKNQRNQKNQKKNGNDVSEHSSVSSGSSLSSGSSRLAIILSDSCCRPARLGVVAFALASAGMDPVRSAVGERDLFGKQLQFTNEATADQLATAANAVMGNAGQSTPAAIIRDHGLPFSDFCGWVEGIGVKEDLYRELFK